MKKVNLIVFTFMVIMTVLFWGVIYPNIDCLNV